MLVFQNFFQSGVPEWIYSVMPQSELEVKKQAVIQERLAKLPAGISRSRFLMRRSSDSSISLISGNGISTIEKDERTTKSTLTSWVTSSRSTSTRS